MTSKVRTDEVSGFFIYSYQGLTTLLTTRRMKPGNIGPGFFNYRILQIDGYGQTLVARIRRNECNRNGRAVVLERIRKRDAFIVFDFGGCVDFTVCVRVLIVCFRQFFSVLSRGDFKTTSENFSAPS